MIRYSVRHRTEFQYSMPVSISHHLLHLAPRRTPTQEIDGWGVTMSPAPAVRSQTSDYFGNPVEHLTIQDEHDRLVIQAHGTVRVVPPVKADPAATPPWETVADHLPHGDVPDWLLAQGFAFPSPMTRSSDEVMDWAAASFPAGRPVLAGCLDLNRRINREFDYDPKATTVTTPVDEVFRIRRGVCQDFAHLMLAGLRALGLPARYVSGYLLTYPPPGGQKLVGSDASHAWVSVLVPGSGWVDLDPTNDKMVSVEHVTLAWGRDYADVSPVKGAIVGGGDHTVKVAVDVQPVPQA